VELVCACVCTYQEPSVYLRAFAILRAGHVLACICTHWGLHTFEHIESWECVCMCCACLESGIFLHLSGADRVSLYVGQYQELSVCTHVSACVKRLACTCMCLFVSSYVSQYQELSMNVHVSALLEILSWICMCWPVSRAGRVFACFSTIQEPVMEVHVLARIKSLACSSTSWPLSKAEHVSALVGVHSEQWCCLHILSCISEGFACDCMCLHLPKT
jgi:hypothetical protein